jgi:hypothetical protein
VPGTPLAALRLTPQQSRTVGVQLSQRIERLRAGGLHPGPSGPEQVWVDRGPDGTIVATRLIDPAPFDAGHAAGWRADGDPLVGPLLRGDARATPPPAGTRPSAVRRDIAPPATGGPDGLRSPRAETPAPAVPSGANGLLEATSPLPPAYPPGAWALLQRALDPQDSLRAMQRLADAARAEGGRPARTAVPGLAPEGAPTLPAAPPQVWTHALAPTRLRDPASVPRITGVKLGKSTARPNATGDGTAPYSGQVVAAITDSTTFDPMTRDALALRQWLEQPPDGHDRGGQQDDADRDESADREDEDRARAPRPQRQQLGDDGRKAG